MGGRGTFASGKNVKYTYETVGKIEGVKVLKGLEGRHSLPVESHSSNAYIKLHHDGTVKELRIYDKEHYLVAEIAYHPEPKLTGNFLPVLHIHEYRRGDFSERPSRLLTDDEYKKYKKYFKGVPTR